MGYPHKICLANLCEANLASREFSSSKSRQQTSNIDYLSLHHQSALLNSIIDQLPDRYEKKSVLLTISGTEVSGQMHLGISLKLGEVTTSTKLSYYLRELMQ